ncbi:MAG: hypothetical protein AAB437_02125, partial [Patescibacteria group bacterium]
MKNNTYKFSVFFLFIFISFIFPYSAHALEKIDVTTIDPQATGYGTFQSNNQKVVANQYGIFVTYLHSRNEAYDQNTWRLSRSTDGGKTFSTIYENINGTSAPVIETDTQGNIYLAHPDWGIGYTQTYALFYIFTPSNNFTNPTISQIPNSASGKYAMMIDEPRGQLYFLAHNGTFSVLGLNGDVRKNYELLTGGSSAYQMYSYLYLNVNGDLYVAWTTQKKDKYMYWDIHFMLSKDGGLTWQKPNGQTLTSPVVSDETGPTDRITLNDEFDVHSWLWTIIVKNGKAHFAYMAQFPLPNTRQHYVRYDLSTAQKDLDIYPVWKGEIISFLNLDGFCATHVSQSDFPIYCISRSYPDLHLGVLVSYDNGTNWHDYAVSDFNDQNLYSIGGAREITSDGYIIGSYTDARDPFPVRFFRIKANGLQSTPTPNPACVCQTNNSCSAGCVFDTIANVSYSNLIKCNLSSSLFLVYP